jgi:hypothetical protein
MDAPQIVKPIPPQLVNERAAYGPFNLSEYIATPDQSEIYFQAELADGRPLPDGMICTGDGIVTGIPAKDTQGHYDVVVTAENGGGSVQATFSLTIKPSLASTQTEYIDQLKAQVWEALGHDLPLPDMTELYSRPVTMADVYYLLERWATITVWDAFNLDPAGERVALTLEGASPHYHVYDRGSCIVAAPKDLFTHERTLEDALQTARAIAREVYQRGWTIEFAGFEKMVRACWVELQLLGDKNGKHLEILHFDPSIKELRVYNQETREIARQRMERL